MSDLLFHWFGPEALSSRTEPAEALQTPQEALYSLSGVMDGPGPSRDALAALSALGVTGAVHLRTLEDDVMLSLNGDGDVAESEERFLP